MMNKRWTGGNGAAWAIDVQHAETSLTRVSHDALAPNSMAQEHIEDPAERRFQPIYVAEPSVEDSISILRGLKERYEVHHGVRIQDAAIIAAVTLSHRYITDRFLPDKAIDLIDEASSKLRIEIDSMPTEIDEIDRRIIQLQIEQQALNKEPTHSKERLRRCALDRALDLQRPAQDAVAQGKGIRTAT
jgi:ATP-dependent Clp protease ATP-binding subunit ClpA